MARSSSSVSSIFREQLLKQSTELRCFYLPGLAAVISRTFV